MRMIAPASAAPMSAPDPTGPTLPYNFATQPSRVQQQQQAAVYNQQQEQQQMIQHSTTRPQSQLQPPPRPRTVQSFTTNNNSIGSSHASGNNHHHHDIYNNSGVVPSNSAFANSLSNNISPSLHPQFRAKAVCRLTCKSCLSDVCMRGMKAILLADSRVELYSTDRPPRGVQLVYDDYRTRNCKCRIRDVACLGCGNTLGYHVTQPCESCLEACNNGHFWMFHSDGVSCTERYLPKSHSRPSSSSSTAQGTTNGSTSVLNSDGNSSSSSGRRRSRSRSSRRRRRRRTWERGSEGSSSQSQEEMPDMTFRRRASIHDMEYNRAVNTGSRANSAEHHDRLDRQGYGDGERGDGSDGSGEGEYDDDDGDDDDDEESYDTEDDEEEKPVVMLWAALHAQEERYLQQMQQELMIQQQQQLLMQQRYLERQRQLEAQQFQQQGPDLNQDHQVQEQEQHQGLQRLSGLEPSLPAVSPPTVGSRYHSMISAAISNASMMLWDEGRSLNQYDKLCR
ncbi:Protein fam72a [Mortierella alpina]|nr:Protein fam72a [Mortierella alpina]